MSYQTDLEKALQELKRQLQSCDEFPNATWRLAVRFGIKCADLEQAYDEDCNRQGDR